MGNENNRPLKRPAIPPVCIQCGYQLLGMIMYLIVGHAAGLRTNISIVSVNQQSCLFFLYDRWQQLSRPEDLILFASPGAIRIAIDTMDKNNVYLPTVCGSEDFSELEALDSALELDAGSLERSDRADGHVHASRSVP